MADISAEIAAFRNAVYGEDVRTAMVNLANKINNESSAADSTVGGYDARLSAVEEALDYRDIVAMRNGTRIVESVTKSDYNATINFVGTTFMLAYRSKANKKMQYLNVNVSDITYNLNNTQSLFVDIDTGNVSIASNNSTVLEGNMVMLCYCLFGVLISPISNFNEELILLQSATQPNTMLKNAISDETLRNRVEPLISVATNQFSECIQNVTYNGLTATVTFSRSITVAIRNKGTASYFNIATANQSYTIGNTQALKYNMTSQTLSIFTVSTTGTNIGADEIILLINFYGSIVSPFSGLNEEISLKLSSSPVIAAFNRRTAPRDFTIMAYGGGNKCVESIAKSGTTATIKFTNTLAFIKRDSATNKVVYSGASIVDSGYEIANTSQLIIDFSNSTLSVTSSNATLNADQCVLVKNLWGLLVSPVASLEEELYSLQIDQSGTDQTGSVTTIEITSNNSFCQIRNAINAITDASKMNRYVLYIKNGTYQEIDIQTKNYVDLVGETKEGVILNCNGLSTETSPSDYFFQTYKDTKINQIPTAYIHLFIHCSNSKISNMTLKANNAKYIIHQDAVMQLYNATVENCILETNNNYTSYGSSYDRGLQNLVGVGAKAGQYQIYRGCSFISRILNRPRTDNNIIENASAVFWHNWNNQSAPCGLTIEGCDVHGCNIANISELGSTQCDNIYIRNVKADCSQSGIFYSLTTGYYKVNNVVVTDPDQIPYCINILIEGCTPNWVCLSKDRINGVLNIINGYTVRSVEVNETVSIGQPIALPSNYSEYGSITNTKPFAVSMSAITNRGFIYVNTGNTAMCAMSAGTYNYGDSVYINNGSFTTTEHNNPVGYVAKSVELTASGFVMVRFE